MWMRPIRVFPLCFRFWKDSGKQQLNQNISNFFQKYVFTGQTGHFKHYDQKTLNWQWPWCCAKYCNKMLTCLDDNINNENPLQCAISAHIWILFKATDSHYYRSSHLVSAHWDEHMFTPKGLHVLNCHACISCRTKGAYAKTEEWITVSATQTQTKRESKWLHKHRWLPLALVSVLHKWFENVFFFPRRPNFSLWATLSLFSTVFVCLCWCLVSVLTTTPLPLLTWSLIHTAQHSYAVKWR